MGLGGIGVWPLLLILVIVLLLFGTKKLRNMGGDIGGAIRGFKDAMNEGERNDKGADSGTAGERSIERQESTAAPDAERKSEHDRNAS